jgi:prophage antirepressor-like protein
MDQNNNIQLFEDKRIRTAWDEEKQEWYFSVVDVVSILTDQPTQRSASKYWSVLKTRMKKEGNQLTTNCRQLKMTAEDGKSRATDVADTEQLLRIIQSIPSPKAEPFKMWLAQVGRERIEDYIDNVKKTKAMSSIELTENIYSNDRAKKDLAQFGWLQGSGCRLGNQRDGRNEA